MICSGNMFLKNIITGIILIFAKLMQLCSIREKELSHAQIRATSETFAFSDDSKFLTGHHSPPDLKIFSQIMNKIHNFSHLW